MYSFNTRCFHARLPFIRHRMFGFDEDDMTDVKTYLSNANVSTLRELHGGQVLLDLCTSLPTISQFMISRGLNGSKISMKIIDNLSLENMISYPVSRYVAMCATIKQGLFIL